jgi:hypothetical protein
VNHAERLRKLADRMGLDGYAEELREIAGEMEALPPAQAWQPIDTAPTDGSAILVSEGRFCFCVEWNLEFNWWAVDDNKLGPFRLRGSAPTHWMPLPPPPATLKVKQ